MLKDDRKRQILAMIMKDGEVQTRKLQQMFNVSDMTIRRDLEYLENEGLITRIHGGAIYIKQEHNETLSQENLNGIELAKHKICEKALTFIKKEQRLFIDSGTTTGLLINKLPKDNDNIVVTNNIRIVSEISKRGDINAMIIGGSLRIDMMSCYGPVAEEQIRRYRVDVAFLGASAVGKDGYFYDSYTPEAGVKQSIIQSAYETYVMVDSTKFNKYNLISYSNVREVTGVITDSGISPEIYDSFQRMGANIIIAD